jgi:hypothetical protein
MSDLFEKLKIEVARLASNPEFIHHKWFVKYHLEIVERISLELCEIYEEADIDLVMGLVWMHDYGKIIDFNNQWHAMSTSGKQLLLAMGFEERYVAKLLEQLAMVESKMTADLSKAPIEVQIVSSADGASHLVGPFYYLWWYENPGKSFEELMLDNEKKAMKDWTRKVTLPEVRASFEARHMFQLEQAGHFPDKFITAKKDKPRE